MSIYEHKKNAQTANCMILTISDTRTEETDKSGQLMSKLLTEAGHAVKRKDIITDDKEKIRQALYLGCETTDIDVILTNGGTGIAKRDVTIEVIREMLEKEMSGFGELFRMISYQEDIGSAAIMSRAIAGICQSTAIFATPGSSGAVKLAMNRLIIPELSHIVKELKKDII